MSCVAWLRWLVVQQRIDLSYVSAFRTLRDPCPRCREHGGLKSASTKVKVPMRKKEEFLRQSWMLRESFRILCSQKPGWFDKETAKISKSSFPSVHLTNLRVKHNQQKRKKKKIIIIIGKPQHEQRNKNNNFKDARMARTKRPRNPRNKWKRVCVFANECGRKVSHESAQVNLRLNVSVVHHPERDRE